MLTQITITGIHVHDKKEPPRDAGVHSLKEV